MNAPTATTATTWVLDRNFVWHQVRPDTDTTICGKPVPADRPRHTEPGTGSLCRPCQTTQTAHATARDHLAEARAALAAARRPEPVTP